MDQLLLLLPSKKKLSRGNRIASTILLIISGVLLYGENILGVPSVKFILSKFHIDYDLESVVPGFGKLVNFIYAIEITISPIIIIFASRMQPYKWAYLLPLYAYINMFVGTILIAKNYKIFDLWWYRGLILLGAILAWWILSIAIKYFDARTRQEELRDLILENYRILHNNDKAA